jgi:hypothetical protein
MNSPILVGMVNPICDLPAGKGLRVIRGSDHGQVQVALKGDVASFDTQANEIYLITPA